MAKIQGSKAADKLGGTSLQDEIMGEGGDDVIHGHDDNDTIFAGSGNDTVFGGAGDDFINAGTGDDTIDAGGGDDIVHAGEGNDTVISGAGNDTYQGGKGFDTIDFSNADQAISVDLSKGTANGMGTDVIQGFERIIGSAHWDDIKGSNAADVIEGGAGENTLRGLGGADTIVGGDERDVFVWRTADLLDTAGNHRGVDTIKNYSGSDGFDISELLVPGSYQDLNDVVRFENSERGSTLQVKINDAFVDVAFIEGASFGTDVNPMAEDKGFILAV
jgi:Ca2+-binding RTX toxin-like protein